MLLSTLLLAGCAAPAHFGREDVGDDLRARTGQMIGPEKPPCDVAMPDFVNWDDGLSENEAIAVGLWNNPSYQALLADLGVARAGVIEADQITNPELWTVFPLSAKQWEFAFRVPLDAFLLRPRRVAAAQLEEHRVAQRLVQDGLNVVRDVRRAYVDLVQAEQQLRLAGRGRDLREDIARIADARLQAGAIAELDASPLRLEALVGKDEVAAAQRDSDLARERLKFLLGIASTEIEVAATAWSGMPNVETGAEELVADALEARPDLRALRIAVDAANERARLAQRDYFNVWGVLPDINSKGIKGFEAGPGLRFNVPIFHQNQGAIARTEAEAERLRRQYVTQRDTVILEVRQALTQLQRSQQILRVWREQAVPQAEAGLAAARSALEEDVVSPLLVLATVGQLLNALNRELQAEADVRRAFVELERSVGRTLDAEAATDSSDEEGSAFQQGEASEETAS